MAKLEPGTRQEPVPIFARDLRGKDLENSKTRFWSSATWPSLLLCPTLFHHGRRQITNYGAEKALEEQTSIVFSTPQPRNDRVLRINDLEKPHGGHQI